MLELGSAEEARRLPRGDIELRLCDSCGFIFNARFDAQLVEYSHRYNPTQAASPSFNRWHRELAERLVERFGLRQKRILEIGCGKGEFLALLAEAGENVGIGFDPACDPGAAPHAERGRVRFVQQNYCEDDAAVMADFVCCKMTLEHIADVRGFLGMLRKSLAPQPKTLVFFQVPDAERILEEVAFWDIYYEHCSYFTSESLRHAFEQTGFDVLEVDREYSGQYLTLTAHPTGTFATGRAESESPRTRQAVQHFQRQLTQKMQQWRARLTRERESGRRVVAWGGGSKGVAFANAMSDAGLEFIVDINPKRQHTYVPVTGQRIVSPEFLCEYRPGLVVVMNPVYKNEVARTLSDLGLNPELVSA
jgi:SAM-dependent methyltransferase